MAMHTSRLQSEQINNHILFVVVSEKGDERQNPKGVKIGGQLRVKVEEEAVSGFGSGANGLRVLRTHPLLHFSKRKGICCRNENISDMFSFSNQIETYSFFN